MVYTEETLDELWKVLCFINESNENELSNHERKTRDILEDFFGELKTY